jgi:hypothetical protein
MAIELGAVNDQQLHHLLTQAKGISKIDHAQGIIKHVTDDLKIPVHWICFDAFYGRDVALPANLVKSRQEFVADVVPLRKYIRSLGRKDWRTIVVRHQSRGKLKAKFHRRDVYLLNPLTGKRMKLILLIRKDPDGTIKYSLCHAPKYIRTRTLAYRQCKRYFIEQSFREAKMELGLNEYQTRSEVGWQRHMALCMLTQLFINTEKLRHKTRNRLKLTAGDILRLIQCRTVFYENAIDKLFRMILMKQPFRKRSLENSIQFTNLTK